MSDVCNRLFRMLVDYDQFEQIPEGIKITADAHIRTCRPCRFLLGCLFEEYCEKAARIPDTDFELVRKRLTAKLHSSGS